MRVLFLTSHLPVPPLSGGRLREHELLRRLAPDVDVHVCAVSKTYEQDVAAIPELEDCCASVSVHRAQAGGDDLPEGLRSNCAADAALYTRRLLGSETRTYELAAWRQADLCAAVTEDDRQAMLRAVPGLDVRLVPDGADHVAGPPPGRPEPRPELVFVGNFAYGPNVDGARWLCAEILPRVRERVPAARVLLVGNAPPPEVLALCCGDVEATGRVARVEPYLDSAAVVVSPLRIGGGIKVKVLEALRRGKAVVSTAVGVQGLGPDVENAIAVADDPARFADACVRLLLDRGERRGLELRALAFAGSLPTWDEAAADLLDCYRELALTPALVDADGADLR